MSRFVAIALLMLGAAVALPVTCGRVPASTSPSYVGIGADTPADVFTSLFDTPVPSGYKGAFAMDIGFFGLGAMKAVTLIPERAGVEEVFGGSGSVRFNTEQHTLVIGTTFSSRQSDADAIRDLQRLVYGDDARGAALVRVFLPAGGREVAAYEARPTDPGFPGLGYFIFPDRGELLLLAGPSDRFDYRLTDALVRDIAAARPESERLYTHIETPQRGPDVPWRNEHGADEFGPADGYGLQAAARSPAPADAVLGAEGQVLPGKQGLRQLTERGVIREARPPDLETWLSAAVSEYVFDAERYRNRLDLDFRMGRAFVVTDATELPPGMHGADSALFIVASGVPAPGGDPGHNTFLFADGRCAGPVCP